ncbi:MAG: hypothetical protein IGS03_00560 [Candidatus Sericytochromatia bacterium]|nr:hypothetical protein [Candidatus Sericytochromatia bacterium]
MSEVIRNRDYIRQIKDFSGLRMGKMMPTDIDGLIEYKNKAFVLFELKHGQGSVRGGQRLALERLTDALGQVRPSVCFVCNHSSTEDIDVARVTVCEFRFQGRWWPAQRVQLAKYIQRFLRSVNYELGA